MIHSFTLRTDRTSYRVVLNRDPLWGPASNPDSEWIIAQIEVADGDRWRVVPMDDPEREVLRDAIIAQECNAMDEAWAQYRKQLARAEATEEV